MIAEFLTLVSFHTVLLSMLGVGLGIFIGAIPGLNGGMLMALTLPLTFFMAPIDAQVLLIGMYVGDVSGGMVAATLMGVAGTPAAIMTTLDAYPMAQKGRASAALGIGIAGSFTGSMLSWLALAFLAAPLASFGLKFGSFEIFALVTMGLVMISAVGGGSFLRAIIAGLIGVLVSLVGLDPVNGQPRLTFGIPELQAGLPIIPVILGVFAIAPVATEQFRGTSGAAREVYSATLRGILRHMRDVFGYPVAVLRSSLVGLGIGILPGIGAAIGSTVSYMVARLSSSTPERFGTGAEEAVIASEAGNNATVCGALIPMISLGIPGSSADVILLAALMIHAIEPGPLLIVERPDIFYGVIGSALLASLLMLPILVLASVTLSNVLRVPKYLVTALVIALCLLGTYVSGRNIPDLWILLAFAVLGYLMLANRFPLPAFVIGFILGPIAESSLRSGLMASRGSLWPLVTRPIPLLFLTLSTCLVIWVILRERRSRRGSPQHE